MVEINEELTQVRTLTRILEGEGGELTNKEVADYAGQLRELAFKIRAKAMLDNYEPTMRGLGRTVREAPE